MATANRGGRLRRALPALGALVLLLVLAAAGGLWWLGTDAGLRFGVSRLQAMLAAGGNPVSLEGASGSLYRGVRIDRFEWQGAGMQARGTGLVARWSLPALLQRKVLVPELSAQTVAVRLPAPDPEPRPREPIDLPATLALPVSVELQRVAIGQLRVSTEGGGSGTGAPAAGTSAASAPAAEDETVIRDVEGQFSYHEGRFSLKDFSARTPYGRIANGNLEVGDAAPHPVRLDLSAQGEVQGVAYSLKLGAGGDLGRLQASATGTAAGAELALDAQLAPLAVSPLSFARARLAKVDLRAFAPLVSAPAPNGRAPDDGPAALPRTLIDAELDLAQDPADGNWNGALTLRNADAGRLADGKLPLLGLDTRLALTDPLDAAARRLQLSEFHAQLPAGRAWAAGATGATASSAATAATGAPKPGQAGTIDGSIDVFPGRSLALFGAAIPEIVANLDFAAIDVGQFGAQLPVTALGGRLALNRNEFALNLSQTAERVRLLLPPTMSNAAAAAEVVVRGRVDDNKLRLDEAGLRLGQSRLSVSGEAGLQQPFRLALKGEASRIEPGRWLGPDAAIDERWRNSRISGSWSVDGTVLPGLNAWLTLRLTDSLLANQPLAADVKAQVVLAGDWKPVRITKAAANVRLGQNRLIAEGALGNPADALTLEVTLAEPELLDPSLRGRLSLEARLAGAFEGLRARASLRGDRLRLARPEGDISLGSLRIVASGPAAATVPPQAPLDVSIALRALQAGGRTLDSMELKTDGTLQAHRFNLSAAGEGQSLRLDGSGTATLDAAPSWRARLAATTLTGTVPIRQSAPADIRVDGGSVLVERFGVAVAGGTAILNRLFVDWRAAPAFEVSGAARSLPVTRLLALAGTDTAVDALQALRLSADWNLSGSSVDDLNGSVNLALSEEVAAAGRSTNTTNATKAADAGNAGSPGAGPLGLGGNNGARFVLVNGGLDGRFNLDLPSLAFTRALTGPELLLDGRLQLTGSVAGTAAQPLWKAALAGSDLSLLQRSVGWRLTGGVLSARLEGREFQLARLRLGAGEGSVEVRGNARLLDEPRIVAADVTAAGPSTLPMDGRFDVIASSLNIPLGPGQRVALSGQTTITSDARGLSLGGKLQVDHGMIEIQGSSAPALPADVTIIDTRPGKSPPTAASPSTPAGRNDEPPAGALRILADLTVDLGNRLRITGNGVAARLAGSLRVLGTLPDEPRLTGLISIVEGSYQAYGQNLRIEKGAIRFNGPVDNPGLDLVAKRPFLPVEVGVAIGGTATNPVIRLISTPEMSDSDKLSWLVLGADPTAAPSAAQTLALREAARALLVNDDGRQRPGVAERLGLDVFNFGYGSDTGPTQGITESMNPTGLPGATQGTSAGAAQQEVVTLGKRLGSRLFVSYEQGVRGLWNLLRIQYTLTRNLSLRAQSGSDNAVDLLYSYSFD